MQFFMVIEDEIHALCQCKNVIVKRTNESNSF